MSEDKTGEELEGKLAVDKIEPSKVIFPDDPKWIPFGAVERTIEVMEKIRYFPQFRTYLPNVLNIVAQEQAYLQNKKI